MATIDRITLTDAELEAARDWIADCEWGDLDAEDIAALTARQVARGVAQHFGLAAFVADFRS